jgi:hypothetical protein
MGRRKDGGQMVDIIGGTYAIGNAALEALKSMGSNPLFSKTAYGQTPTSSSQAGVQASSNPGDSANVSRGAGGFYGDASFFQNNPYDTPKPEKSESSSESSSTSSSSSETTTNDTGATAGIIESDGDIKTTRGYQKDGTKITWVEPESDRPGFISANELRLDTKTWQYVTEGYTPLQAVNKRIGEETNPQTLRELDWQRTQLAQNKIEMSSDYHHWARDTGKTTAVNPFENEGDMALALKQGTQQESRLQIAKSNPSASDLFGDLPGGRGLEDASWTAAKTSFTTRPADFADAINHVESARDDLGIYGTLSSDGDYSEWNASHPQAQVYSGGVVGYRRGKYKPRSEEMSILQGIGFSRPYKPSRPDGKAPIKSQKRFENDLLSNILGVSIKSVPRVSTSERKAGEHTRKKKGFKGINESALFRDMGLMTKSKKPQKPVQKKTSSKKSKPESIERIFWGI